MLSTVQFPCSLPKAEADALNAESGRVYTDMLVQHYRRYRKQDVWLSARLGERLEDATGGPTTLHAHSPDAAQQGFYKACKTAKACRELGIEEVCYPHKRKRFRTTIWKHTGIRKQANSLLLARAKGLAPVLVALPTPLVVLPATAFLEARLVWDRAARHYTWHLVIEDGLIPEPARGTGVVAGRSRRDSPGGLYRRYADGDDRLPRHACQPAVQRQAPLRTAKQPIP
jgi:putative transposase